MKIWTDTEVKENEQIASELRDVEIFLHQDKIKEADKLIDKVYNKYRDNPEWFTEMDEWEMFLLLDKISTKLYH